MDWAGHLDVSREAAADHTAVRAAAAGGMVLLTLASAQFLMTLHSSGDERIDRHRRGDFGATVSAGAIAVVAGPATLGS
jgi:hypothetical protein